MAEANTPREEGDLTQYWDGESGQAREPPRTQRSRVVAGPWLGPEEEWICPSEAVVSRPRGGNRMLWEGGRHQGGAQEHRRDLQIHSCAPGLPMC